MNPGISPTSTKVRAGDYPDTVKPIILAAVKRYKAPLLSLGGYIADTDRFKWAGHSWIDECREREANYTSDLRVCKVVRHSFRLSLTHCQPIAFICGMGQSQIKARGPNIRGDAMKALRPIVVAVFEFKSPPKYIKRNIRIYEHLKKGGWSFQYKVHSVVPGRTLTQNLMELRDILMPRISIINQATQKALTSSK